MSDEIAWVVVRGTPVLEYFEGPLVGMWSADHADAWRFARKIDAIRMLRAIGHYAEMEGSGVSFGARVEEHMWVGPDVDFTEAEADRIFELAAAQHVDEAQSALVRDGVLRRLEARGHFKDSRDKKRL